MTVTPLHRAGPVPITPPDRIAPVIQLPTAPQPARPAPRTPTGRRYPPRRGRGGHHPDCPCSAQTSPDHCGVCQGLRKGVRW